MTALLRWGLPGLVLAAPLHLCLTRWGVVPPWPVSLVAALPLGFAVQQIVRWRFEARDNGFRSPRRAALAVIIERGNLGQRPDRGDVAYQVYESVFYQRPDWQALRDHAHRCRDHQFLSASVAVACAAGAVLAILGVGAQPVLAVLYVLVLPPIGFVVHTKGQQTLDALELFDRAVVLSNWPLYETALHAIMGAERQAEERVAAAQTAHPTALGPPSPHAS